MQGVRPILGALLRLQSLSHSIFANVKMTAHPQSTRFRVYTLIDTFMAHQRRGPALSSPSQ
jgi:hypothetical protein